MVLEQKRCEKNLTGTSFFNLLLRQAKHQKNFDEFLIRKSKPKDAGKIV
jgi:hypothetical protein